MFTIYLHESCLELSGIHSLIKNKKLVLNIESHCFEQSSYTRPLQSRLEAQMESPSWNAALWSDWYIWSDLIKMGVLTVTFPNRSGPACTTMELFFLCLILTQKENQKHPVSAEQLPFYCSFLCPHSYRALTLKWPVCVSFFFLSPFVSFTAFKKNNKTQSRVFLQSISPVTLAYRF